MEKRTVSSINEIGVLRPLRYVETIDGASYGLGSDLVESMEYLPGDAVIIMFEKDETPPFPGQVLIPLQPRTVCIPWHFVARLDFVEPLPDEDGSLGEPME